LFGYRTPAIGIALAFTEPVGVPREDVTEGWDEPAGKRKEAAN
jgi:hypothetical protein